MRTDQTMIPCLGYVDGFPDKREGGEDSKSIRKRLVKLPLSPPSAGLASHVCRPHMETPG